MQMGRTKVFLRLRAFEALEHLRSTRINAAATSIQSMARMFIERSRFEIAVFAASIIQDFVRRIKAHRVMRQQRLYHSATAIQNAWKCFVPRRRLGAGRCIAWWGQSIYRGTVARQYCAYLFLDGKASLIQRRWKRYCASHTFRRIRKAVVRLQNRQRSRVAFRELLLLRREARDLSSVAAERDTLRRETLRLRKELEQVKQSPPVEQRISKQKELEAERLRFEVQRLQHELEKAHSLTSPSKSVDADLQALIDECARKEEELDVMRRELDAVRTLEFPESPSFARSFAFDQSPVARSNNGLNGSFHLSSPARADVSLLDAEGEVPTAAEGAISFHAVRDEQLVNRSFASIDVSEGPTGEEVRHLNASIRHGKNQLFDQVLRQSNDPIALIHQGDNFGRTSLHLAVQTLNLKLVETLIGNGAVANTHDNDGETPLHLAENVAMTELLLKKGKANPNIPNVDGICALHLAVQRRDIDSVRALLRSGASVNNADNIRWFTALHLISLPARNQTDDRAEDDVRSRIAQLLSGSYDANEPDFDYQDSEGNTPLHYAVQLETPDACDLVTIFLEKGADPNICNDRDQSPLHLLCHNEELRNVDVYQEILHAMLFHGADPNLQSMTGCTPMHLSLYHRDIDSAVQLVSHGAELHVLWRKVSVPPGPITMVLNAVAHIFACFCLAYTLGLVLG
jgi:ankyrin repeat protein